MSGLRKSLGTFFHSGGSSSQKPGRDEQQPDTQQPGGGDGQQPRIQQRGGGDGQASNIQHSGVGHGQQPNYQQPQSPERGSRKGSARGILRSLSPFKKTTRSAPEATATGYARPLPQSGSGRTSIAVSSNNLIPPGLNPGLSAGKSDTGLDGGDDIVLHVHCSPAPQNTASSGKPEVSTASNSLDIVIIHPSPRNPVPVSTHPQIYHIHQ